MGLEDSLSPPPHHHHHHPPPHQQFLIILYFCTTLFYFLFRGRHFKLDGSFANTACLFFVLIAVCTLALLLYSYREGVRQRERDRER